YHLTYTLRTNLGGEEDLKQAEDRFVEARKKLLAEGGGVVSVFYHPCEFVHKQFWDAANFSKGANPPREEWKLPPQKTEAETRAAFANFEGYIRFIKRFPDVQFITARQAAELYRDEAQNRDKGGPGEFGDDDLKQMASAVSDEVTWQKRRSLALAPSEILWLMTADLYLYEQTKWNGHPPVKLPLGTPFGPTGIALRQSDSVTTNRSQFLRSTQDVLAYMKAQNRVPSTVWLGSIPVTPEAYMFALANVVKLVNEGKDVPEQID